jgi:spore maturation protein CgeB
MRCELGAMSLYRRDLIRTISHLGVMVCGDPGWRRLFRDEVRFLGYLDNRKELPKLYNASKINLNITKSQLRTALPMRVFDISASGAFLLTDYRRDLGELFDLEGEIVFYRDREDLRRKAEYYLAHEDEREEIAERARQRILRDHTYRDRLEEMIKVVKRVFRL